ncbi:MAG: cell division protein ZapE [Rickettsiaceae bacterium H1]|nr:cell division protein ZapE [Rickettsiaceae bacterium H1]
MSVTAAYQFLIKDKDICRSEDQAKVIRALQNFDDQIGFFSKCRGIYLHGEVGRGKSFIMNLYFDNSKLIKRKRIHFYEFMQEIHSELKLLKNKTDPLNLLGKSLAKKVKLLFLDELEVCDIMDAMILSRLFDSLFKNRIFVLITSNYYPDQLYRNGLRRENFFPTIELIKNKMQIIKIGGEIDYRLTDKTLIRYFINDTVKFESVFQEKTNNLPIVSKTINVHGRTIKIEKTVGKIAYFTFEELCEKPLITTDYNIITENFSTIFLSEIPIITDRNEAKRFMILIDILYEHKTEFFCSAQCNPEFICNIPRTYSRLIEMCKN